MKLLDFYFFGTLPPKVESLTNAEAFFGKLEFDPSEWAIIGMMARREGVTAEQWIVGKVRSFLAWLEATSVPLEGGKSFPSSSHTLPIGFPLKLPAAPAANVPPLPAPGDDADTPGNVLHLPFYGSVAAGQPAGPLDVDDGTLPVPVALVGRHDPASLYVLRVNGQSMEPAYPDASLVLCRKLRLGEFAKKGQDVVSCDASGVYLKRLLYTKEGIKGAVPRKATPHLVSLNPEFPEVVPLADCPISAVVVAKID